MKFNYPDGRKFKQHTEPSNLTTTGAKKVIFGDRGMRLEDEINESNKYYRAHDIAVIYKKPTPIQIVKVDYPKRSKAVIKEAYFRQASTTDYNGVYQGHYLDFEAKETTNKNTFPLKNFHQHQIDHLRACEKQGGICFVIIKYVTLKRYFIMPAQKLFVHWEAQRNDGPKSIQLSEVVNDSYEITANYNPTLPYIETINKLIESRKEK
ncbi:Holliday junction resolvase RecU [Companilactobacillus sp.]|uniref:Holliday junction resolvase RecU n=1 Tax=Companilactobacillus sp. TaxID=2767905 RepID=UPI0025BBEDC5|nr:Holliday junction resolvase RecU [Companilactobacillus sp.]MCH4008248.1 Holliday junction resolvase RecU [Companilactobacillus sp.]MCH4051573.1 Holliday junction resolvase RecU [Companilactobacillus sp.]MCH4076191.1 Holliday junction resolvase RecU [Companilactobacillus sp.]MCH4124766.1 Holliday junction resolvase RecU [Companilactobacillus sp.]MCH4131308.1 Holliday junction resolvase RecU [Companilactobacillus sp.]